VSSATRLRRRRRASLARRREAWTKDWGGPNPIVNNTQRDPSAAWRTPDGEWRFTTFDQMVYGSLDFVTW
jgi:hypothetical protein